MSAAIQRVAATHAIENSRAAKIDVLTSRIAAISRK
jgi:hypothetical protein